MIARVDERQWEEKTAGEEGYCALSLYLADDIPFRKNTEHLKKSINEECSSGTPWKDIWAAAEVREAILDLDFQISSQTGR